MAQILCRRRYLQHNNSPDAKPSSQGLPLCSQKTLLSSSATLPCPPDRLQPLLQHPDSPRRTARLQGTRLLAPAGLAWHQNSLLSVCLEHPALLLRLSKLPTGCHSLVNRVQGKTKLA